MSLGCHIKKTMRVYKENGKNEVKEFLEKCLKITEK